MEDIHLSKLDDKIGIGGLEFTRRQIKEKYNSSNDDIIIKNSLAFARDFLKRTFDNKETIPISEFNLFDLECSAIQYFDCLPINHPTKKEYSPTEVNAFLIVAREAYYRGNYPKNLDNSRQNS